MNGLSQEVIDAYQGGLSMHECARRFGMSRTSLSYRLKKAGIRIKQKAEIIAEQFADAPWRDKALMLDLYETQGKSTIEIAKHFSCDKSVVVDWLNKFGAKMRTTADTQKGRTPGNAGKGKRNSTETVLCGCGCGTEVKRFTFNSQEVRFAPGHRIKGEAHPLYKPWSGNRLKKHTSAEYRDWRRQVLKASDYTCSCCGKVGGSLQSHHVAPVAKHPQFMFDVGNGKAMCKPCHTEVHVAFREIF
jgi:transposase-like protein